MDKLKRIDEMFVRGHIDKAEYEALYDRYKPKESGAAELVGLISKMSLEDLLELYKDAERMLGKAGASVIHLLIVAELDKRING